MSYPVRDVEAFRVYRASFGGSIGSVHRHKPLSEHAQYREAIVVLRAGGLVALPTDTVFRL
jgi:hypothetical protein